MTLGFARNTDISPRSFVSDMKRLTPTALDFESTVRRGLPDALGEVPSEILFRMLSRKARREPRAFSKEVTRLFGRGAGSVLASVEMHARDLCPPVETPQTRMLVLAATILGEKEVGDAGGEAWCH